MEQFKLFADGRTEPPLSDRSLIILVQGGRVSLGKLILKNYAFMPGEIEHPRNEQDLKVEAKRLIKEAMPLVLDEHQAVLLRCPEELALKMLW